MLRRNTPEEFRSRALECEMIALEATDAHARDTLLLVAARWRSLAAEDEAKRGSRLDIRLYGRR